MSPIDFVTFLVEVAALLTIFTIFSTALEVFVMVLFTTLVVLLVALLLFLLNIEALSPWLFKSVSLFIPSFCAADLRITNSPGSSIVGTVSLPALPPAAKPVTEGK